MQDTHIQNSKKPTIPKNFIKDSEGNYDIDGVSLAPEGVVVSGDEHTPTEDTKDTPKNQHSKKNKMNPQPSREAEDF